MSEALAILVSLAIGCFVAVGCSTQIMGGDPERSLTLPNNTSGPRMLFRCDSVDDCRSPGKGKLVRRGDAFEFDAYADQQGAYVVANVEGTTFGCIKFFIADGVSPNPESLSDMRRCPRGTPNTL
jgi:hypothetical protein